MPSRLRQLLSTGRRMLLATVVLVSSWVVRRRRRGPSSTAAPRVLLIGAYGNGNFGDDVIAHGVAASVRRAGGSVAIAARQDDVALLTREVTPDVTVVGGGVGSLLRTWRLAADSDIAILGGGGLLETRADDTGVQRLVLEYLGKLMVCGLRGNRVLIHGIGIAPQLYSNQFVNRAVVAALRAVELVTVRDPRSMALLDRKGVTRSTLVRDPATAVFEEIARDLERDPDVVGVVLLDHRRWPMFVVGDPESERLRSTELRSLAEGLAAYVADGARLRLFHFHSSDRAIVEDLATALGTAGVPAPSLELVPFEQDSSQGPFALLMACGRVHTMRFHPGLAALTAGAEVEVIGALQKLEELRRSFGAVSATGWMFSAQFEDPDAVLVAQLVSR